VSVRLTKPWLDLQAVEPEAIPAQLGVFELADADGEVLYVGYAGGREPFGLRSAVATAVEAVGGGADTTPARFRYELTHGYLSRWEELLMVHVHDSGSVPIANQDGDEPRGRLNPATGAPSRPRAEPTPSENPDGRRNKGGM